MKRQPLSNVQASLAYKGRTLWLFIKYQLLTKGFLTLLIYPIYQLVLTFLLNQSGITVFSSGDFMTFLLSFNGIGLLVATLALLMILIGLDINSFIIMSALIQEGKIEMTARYMISIGLKSLKQFFSPLGLLMMVYIALIFPLIGIGVTISPMRHFQIPNFITSVIYTNPLYLSLYSLTLLILAYVSYRLAFVFHYVLILGYPIKAAVKESLVLTKQVHWVFWKDLLVSLLKRLAWLYLPMALLFVALSAVLLQLADSEMSFRFLIVWLFLTLAEVLALIAFVMVPMVVLTLTELFYKYHQTNGHTITLKLETQATTWREAITHKVRLTTKVAVGLALFIMCVSNIALSGLLTLFFDQVFVTNNSIQIIAHRAGGDLGAENTVEGVIKAAQEGASWTEIDIQRTKDGAYILNHDANFKRVAGEARQPSELTLDEVQALAVENLFDTSQPAQPVPTIEEIVTAAKGKIGLFMELKGQTADTKMVDDMVVLIKREHLEDQAVLLSLDYSLITYIEKTYPEIQSGYLYYFAIGQTAHLLGDYLIMEEREATPEKVAQLKAKGKHVVVWTVNTPDSIETFVTSNVDGIITDHVLAVKEGLARRDNRNDLEWILDKLFG